MRLSAPPAAFASPLRSYQVEVVSESARTAAADLVRRVSGDHLAQVLLGGRIDVELVESGARAAAVARMLEAGPQVPVGFDFETEGWSPDMHCPDLAGEQTFVRGVSPWRSDVSLVPVTFQIWRGAGEPVYVVLGEHLHLFLRWLRDLAVLDGSNLPFEQCVVARCGGSLPRIHRDTIHMDFLLEETTRTDRHGLKECEEDYLGVLAPSYKFPKGFRHALESDLDGALRYAAHDAWGSRILADVLQAKLDERPSRAGYDSLWDFYAHAERPYSQSIAGINAEGIPVLIDRTRVKLAKLADEVADVDARAYKVLGRAVNLSSNKDLSRYFYVEQGHPVKTVTDGWMCLICDKQVSKRTDNLCREHGAGALVSLPKVDEAALTPLVGRDPLAALVMERRGYEKLRGSYVEPFFTRSSPATDSCRWSWGEGARIHHPGLKASSVVSGRLSAPLALTIPKQGFKDQFGFPEGHPWVLVDVDEAQIELRVMAELSGDPILLEAFELGRDMHSVTGALVEGYLTAGSRVLTDKGLRDALYDEVVRAKKADVRGMDPGRVLDRIQHLRSRRQHGKCFHPETEVLTRTGWRRILDLARGEEVVQAWPIRGQARVELEWSVPLEVSSLRHPSRALVELESDTLSMSLTPDHRSLVFRGLGYDVVCPGEIQRDDVIMPGGCLAGGRALTEREACDLRVALAVQADGSYARDGSVDVRFKKERKITRFDRLLRTANLSHRKFPKDDNGYVRFRIPPAPSVRVRRWLTDDKRLPWSLLELDLDGRRLVLDEIVHWDSTVEDGGYRYSTAHEQCADVVQALAAVTDRRSRVSRDREHLKTRVSDADRSEHRMQKMTRRVVPHDAPVACLSVPSTFVLCRLRGTTFVSGQTLNFAVLYGVGDDALSTDLGVSLAEARQISAAIGQSYAGMTAYVERKIREMTEGEPVLVTLGGRRRVILELKSRDPGVRAAGERLAANQSAQCGARDVLMGAMIQAAVDQEAGTLLAGRGTYGSVVGGAYAPDFDTLPKAWRRALPAPLRDGLGSLGRWGARMCNQIHDELLLNSPAEHAEAVEHRIVSMMEDPWGDDLVFRVKLKAEGCSGKDWQEAKGE